MKKSLLKNQHSPFIILIIVLIGIRTFFGSYLNLGDDEAYYWEWGQHLDWSYLDHPPMTAWMGRLFSSIFGNSEIGTRLGPILFSIIFLYLIYTLTYQLFRDYKFAFRAVLLFAVIPVFSAGSFMLLPDAPLSLFWLLAVSVFYRIIITGNGRHWVILGIVWGLGMLSKYNMVLLPICIGLFLIFSDKQRFWLKRFEMWFGFLLGILVFAPVILWNIYRGFPSLALHLVERNDGFSLSFEPFMIFLTGQLAYLSPLVFIIALVAIVSIFKVAIRDKDERSLFLICMSVPYLLIFSIACSLSPTTKPHWPAMGYIVIFCSLPWLWGKKWHLNVWWKKIFSFRPVIVTAAVVTTVLLTQTLYPVIETDPALDMTNELYGWPEAGEQIQREFNRLSKDAKTVVFTQRYNVASQVAFYTPDHISAYSITSYNEQYDYWKRGTLDDLPIGSSGIYVANSRYKPLDVSKFSFESNEALPPIIVKRKGKIVRKIYLFLCTHYLGK